MHITKLGKWTIIYGMVIFVLWRKLPKGRWCKSLRAVCRKLNRKCLVCCARNIRGIVIGQRWIIGGEVSGITVTTCSWKRSQVYYLYHVCSTKITTIIIPVIYNKNKNNVYATIAGYFATTIQTERARHRVNSVTKKWTRIKIIQILNTAMHHASELKSNDQTIMALIN